MIELLGVGVARKRGGWLLRRVCVELDAPHLTVVLSSDLAERSALLDVIAGRVIPEEGRAWIDRLPVMRETRHRLRTRVAEIDASAWRGADAGARFAGALATAVREDRSHLIVRELGAGLRDDELVVMGRALRRLVDARRVSVLVSAASYGALVPFADRLLVIADAQLVVDAPPMPTSVGVAALA